VRPELPAPTTQTFPTLATWPIYRCEGWSSSPLGCVERSGDRIEAGAIGIQNQRKEKIAPYAVDTTEIAENGVESADVAPDSLAAGDLGAGSVGSSEVADQSLTDADLAPNSVGSSELQAGAVRASELGPIIQVSDSNPVPAGAFGTVSVNCPAGTTVISGGAQPANFGVEMTSSLRSGNGWLYQAKNDTANASTLTVFAYCLTGGTSN
jgi:hypothetical protein